ncbi:MAG: hypothetical protein ACPGQL_01595 [Thermoplasmatota archaeon]
MRPGLILACLVLVAASPAATAGFTAELAAPLPERIVPQLDLVDVPVLFTLDCVEQLIRQGPAAGSAEALAVTFDAPAPVVISGPSEILVPSCQPGDEQITSDLIWSLAISRDAEAMVPLAVTMTATLPADPAGLTVAEAKLPFPVVPDYYGLIDVQMDDKLFEVHDAGSQEVALRLMNFGNGPTRVDVTVIEGPADWLEGPASVVLEAVAAPERPAAQDVVLRFDVPMGFGGQQTLKLSFTGSSTVDATRTTEAPVEATLVFRDRTGLLSQATPGPEMPVVSVALLAGAALAARRRA